LPEDENLTLLDKRISDLEISFSEVKDKIEEIEDLVMVEQAGIVEIKNMIEEVKATSPEVASVMPAFEERLKKLENEIASVSKGRPEMPGEGVLPVAEIDRIYKRINELEDRISQAKPEKGVDYSFLSSIDALKKDIEKLSFERAEADSKLEVVERKIEDLKNSLRVLTEGGPVSEAVINEKEIEELNMKIGSIEKTIDGITSELRAREREKGPTLGKELGEDEMKKIYESVSILSKEVDENRREIFQKATEVSALAKKIEESNRALSSSVYLEIKAFKERMETLEAQYHNLSKQMKDMRPEDFERAMEKIGAMAVSIEDRYRKELEGLKATISRVVNELKTSAVMDKEISELLEKVVFLESRLKVVEKNIDEVRGSKPVVLE